MKRTVISILSLVLLFTLTTGQALAEDPAHMVRLHGVIAEVGPHHILLHTDRGDVAIDVNRATRIMRNGRPARLGDLQRGDHARVHAEVIRRDGRRHFLAHAIHARGE
ncbi:MAG: hypothetical protein D8M59_07915 [Planctomycetes bacterium]|nr:hypothetical protein [Planctomycetota bacterium]NOG53248.1 hypothetical protein [Planctomycetota bacterium]